MLPTPMKTEAQVRPTKQVRKPMRPAAVKRPAMRPSPQPAAPMKSPPSVLGGARLLPQAAPQQQMMQRASQAQAAARQAQMQRPMPQPMQDEEMQDPRQGMMQEQLRARMAQANQMRNDPRQGMQNPAMVGADPMTQKLMLQRMIAQKGIPQNMGDFQSIVPQEMYQPQPMQGFGDMGRFDRFRNMM